MSKKTPVVLPREIRDLVEKIEATAEKSDEHTIEAAKRLRELRRLIEAGEVGEVDWYIWVDENVRLRKSRVRALLRIAEAPDPRAEAVRQRKMNGRRQLKYRAGQARLSDLAPECREIITGQGRHRSPLPERFFESSTRDRVYRYQPRSGARRNKRRFSD